MSVRLQDILADIREKIEYYHTLPKRKQRRGKYWEAYVSCVRLEMMLQDTIRKEGQGKSTTSRV